MLEIDNQTVAKKSKQAAWISLFGFLLVVIAFVFAANGINTLTEEKRKLITEKEKLTSQVDSLSNKKTLLQDEYVSLVKGFGWSDDQIEKVSAQDPRFLDAVRSINEIRTLLGKAKSEPDSTNIDLLHVYYTMLEEDFGSIEKALSTINITTEWQKSTTDKKRINEIRFAKGMLPNDIKIVAYTLLSAGIELNSIKVDTDPATPSNTMTLGITQGDNLTRISAADIKARKSFEE